MTYNVAFQCMKMAIVWTNKFRYWTSCVGVSENITGILPLNSHLCHLSYLFHKSFPPYAFPYTDPTRLFLTYFVFIYFILLNGFSLYTVSGKKETNMFS